MRESKVMERLQPVTGVGSTILMRRTKPQWYIVVKWHACPPEAPVDGYTARWLNERGQVCSTGMKPTAHEARQALPFET